jgi:peptidoglycan/LPS O-acetylase OafA/YrhL
VARVRRHWSLYHGRPGFFTEDSELTKLSGAREFHRNGGVSLRRFYIRRCFRILPPYYAALALFSAVSVFGAIHVNYSYVPSCWLFYRNYKQLGMDENGVLSENGQ